MSLAAVYTGGTALDIECLDIEPPRPGEIAIRLGAAGLCGSDRSVANGTMPGPMPMVLGHQGAGSVTATGSGVSDIAVGDRVAVVAISQCGNCPQCVRGRRHLCAVGMGALASGLPPHGTSPLRDRSGTSVRQFMGAGTFAQDVVVAATSVVVIPPEVSYVAASILGCAGLTGFGAAVNTASIEPGNAVVVIGCGAVGIFAIQGARLAGAGKIIAIDVARPKLELALSLGADVTVDAAADDSVAAVRRLTGGVGADVVIEAVGSQQTVDQAVRMTARGGEAVFVGAGGADTMVRVKQYSGLIAPGISLTGCFLGSSDARRDVPRLVRHYLAGDVQIDPLISRRIALTEVNDGLAGLGGADLVTAVIDFDQEPPVTEALRAGIPASRTAEFKDGCATVHK